MHNSTWRRSAGIALLAGLFLSIDGAGPAADKAVIDSFRYASDAEAQAAWSPARGSAPAAAAQVNGERALRLTCNFAGTTFDHASWDRKVKLDLAAYQGFQLRLQMKNLRPVERFSLHLQSGDGWYWGVFFPDSTTGWSTVEVDKAAMRIEGHPAGWEHIETIRITALRGRDEDAELLVGGLRGYGALGQDAAVAILRDDSAPAAEFTTNVARNLRELGIRYSTVSDSGITAGRLREAKLAILPYDLSVPERTAAELVRYLERGGRLLAFRGLPPALRAAVKMEGGEPVKAQMSGLRFPAGALAGAPSTVGQRSGNVIAAKPVAGASRTLAHWLDERGQPTPYPAVIASRNCIWMTHGLLRDDPINQRRMMLAMVGQLAPAVLGQSTGAAIARIGAVGTAKSFEEAVALISRGRKDKEVRAGVESATRLQKAARTLAGNGKYAAASAQAGAAHDQLVEAFARSQPAERGEFRAVWCHNAFRAQGMDWDEAIRHLAENGFTAIIVNMMSAGSAFYPSQVLPVAKGVVEQGDQLAKCLAACRKYGIQMHVWNVNWNLGNSVAPEYVERLRSEGRLQSDSHGVQELWLCPSHPENRKLEIASMLEVVRNYDVDGIHFDYIRYRNAGHCFCDGCRRRFAQAAGVAIEQWPRDVMADGPYRQQWLDWRRSNITAVVKGVSDGVRQVRPKVKISAAVFRNWSPDRDTIGQDWKLWCERGYLDFICPMDYTENDTQFDVWVAGQREGAGKVPVYPGIGASSSWSMLSPDRVIGQIEITRRHRTGGFVIFNYGERESRELLPALSLGTTRR
jgi:uncharacterized lipoprotein YddW (UPF0748 family)